MTENEQNRRNKGNGCPGLGFLLFGMAFIVMVCLGYTFIPYVRYGGDRALQTWPMWAIGLLLIAMSFGGVIRQMRTRNVTLGRCLLRFALVLVIIAVVATLLFGIGITEHAGSCTACGYYQVTRRIAVWYLPLIPIRVEETREKSQVPVCRKHSMAGLWRSYKTLFFNIPPYSENHYHYDWRIEK